MAITQSGTSITFNDATTQTTAYTGAVTSVATSGGVTGGTITTTGTISLDTNNANGIGSNQFFWYTNTTTSLVPGNTVSGSYLFQITSIGSSVVANNSGSNTIGMGTIQMSLPRTTAATISSGVNAYTLSPVTGTWRVLSGTPKGDPGGPCLNPCTGVVQAIRIS